MLGQEPKGAVSVPLMVLLYQAQGLAVRTEAIKTQVSSEDPYGLVIVWGARREVGAPAASADTF